MAFTATIRHCTQCLIVYSQTLMKAVSGDLSKLSKTVVLVNHIPSYHIRRYVVRLFYSTEWINGLTVEDTNADYIWLKKQRNGYYQLYSSVLLELISRQIYCILIT